MIKRKDNDDDDDKRKGDVDKGKMMIKGKMMMALKAIIILCSSLVESVPDFLGQFLSLLDQFINEVKSSLPEFRVCNVQA